MGIAALGGSLWLLQVDLAKLAVHHDRLLTKQQLLKPCGSGSLSTWRTRDKKPTDSKKCPAIPADAK